MIALIHYKNNYSVKTSTPHLIIENESLNIKYYNFFYEVSKKES
jgi:hypothetical protein